MDSQEKKEQFDLDDIIREFSQKDADTDTLLREMFSQTPKVSIAPMGGDTVRIELPQAQPEPAAPSETPEMPEPEQEPEMPPMQETEPFSENWEPEYEEPMGDFEAKEPIVFPAKNRTRQLREKLVAGPEKRYQDLSAAGLGSLNWGIFFQVLLTALTLGTALVAEAGKVTDGQLQTLLFVQLIALLLSGLLGCYRLLNGMGSLLRGQFTLNTLLCVSFAVCTLDAYACLQDHRMPLSGLFCLQMLMAQMSARQQRVTEMGQMDTLRKANDLIGVVRIDHYQQNRPGYAAVVGEPEDFTKHYAAPSAPEKALWRYSLVVLAVSVLLGLYAGFQMDIRQGIRSCATVLLIGLPASAHISMSRPMAIVQKRLSRLDAVLCGWYGIRYAEKDAIYPVTSEDLFPEGSIKMNGVKFYGSVDPGWVTSSAVALLNANGSSMLRVFEQLPRGRDGLNQFVEQMTVCDGGISGLVSGVPTLLGTAEFMQAMQVDLPQGAVIADAVYVAVDGELSGVYALSYSCDKSAAAGLRNLCSWRSLSPVLVSSDYILSPRFIREKLGVKPRRMRFPERQERQELAAVQPGEDAPVLALTTRPGLASKTYALNCAWALRSSLSTGANIHMLGGVMGLLLSAIMIVMLAFEMLSPTNLLLYTMLWMVPGWLITEQPRFQ